MFENLEMPSFPHFQNQIGKMGHFEKKSRDQILKREKNRKCVRFRGISKKDTNAVT